MNKKVKKYTVWFLCILLLATVCGCSEENDLSYQDATVIATVDGVEITRGQLNQRVDMLAASMAQQYQVELSRETHPDFYDALKDVAFEDLTLGILFDQAATEEGFEVERSDVEAYMAEMEEYAGLLGQTLEEYLSALCADREIMELEYARTAFLTEKQNQLGEQIEVSDEEAREYYDANLYEFTTPGGIQISHILVETEEEADDLIAQLNEGADFAELAQNYSIDTASAQQGGDVGTVNEDTSFVSEFKEAALALEPGEITQTPVQSSFGWHIIKAGERVEETVQPFEDAKTLIVYSLKNVKMQEALMDYAQELKDAADIQDRREEQDKSSDSLMNDTTEENQEEEPVASESTETVQ